MTTFHIKLIAIVSMIIDHVGLFFFPHLIILRIIGRLAFPLFAWLIANGAYHTHNINSYLKRLLLFAFISQIPFSLAYQHIGYPAEHLNVLFTLFLGLLSIAVIQKTKNKLAWVAAIGTCAILAQSFSTDYGAAGVLSVAAFYIFFNNFSAASIAQITIFAGQLLINSALLWLYQGTLPAMLSFYLQPLCLVSLILISLYNRQPGRRAKWLFYIIYPAQYLVVLLIYAL